MTGRLPTPTTSLRRFDLFLPLALGQHQLVAQGPPDQVTNYIFALPPKHCQVTPLRQSLTAAACEELLVPGVRLSGRRCIFDEGKSLVKASGPNEGFSQRRTGVRSPPYLDDGACVPPMAGTPPPPAPETQGKLVNYLTTSGLGVPGSHLRATFVVTRSPGGP